ncbi:MAG: hypothetical protein MI861_16055, partial [Pirellulales bacterium]|nr:hypothetical protein [Pirellulales bacterium]
NDQLCISDRAGHEVVVDARFPKLAAEQLAAAGSPQFKLRPRALLTTMYARLVLSDLFLHGIGGAKYDQLGDMIIRSFFNVAPPRFMVISATIELPGLEKDDRLAEIERLRRRIRDCRFQPERLADEVSLEPGLVQRKRELLLQIPLRGKRLAWHNEIERINQTLAQTLRGVRAELANRLAGARREAASQALLAGREHPFCLFPLAYLTENFNALLRSG